MSLAMHQPPRRLPEVLAVAAAVLVTVVLVHSATGSVAATMAFGGGLVVLGLVAFAAGRMRTAGAEIAAEGGTDWSVTVAAIEEPDSAIAITDRANRLVCANSAFEAWFGSGHAPPRLPVDDSSAETLNAAARAAWRDG